MRTLNVRCEATFETVQGHLLEHCQDCITSELDFFENGAAITRLETKIKAELGVTIAKFVQCIMPAIVEEASKMISKKPAPSLSNESIPLGAEEPSSSVTANPLTAQVVENEENIISDASRVASSASS